MVDLPWFLVCTCRLDRMCSPWLFFSYPFFFAYLSHPEPRSNKKNPFLFKSSLAFPGDTHSRELFIFEKKKKKKKNSFGIDHTQNRGDDIFENCVMNQQQNSNVISYSFLWCSFGTMRHDFRGEDHVPHEKRLARVTDRPGAHFARQVWADNRSQIHSLCCCHTLFSLDI